MADNATTQADDFLFEHQSVEDRLRDNGLLIEIPAQRRKP